MPIPLDVSKNAQQVLQVCNDYYGQKIYKQLFTKLRFNGFNQAVHIFLRKDQLPLIKDYQLEEKELPKYVVKLSSFYSWFGRVFPFQKNRKLMTYLNNEGIFDQIELMHAHTLYSNGSLVHQLSRDKGIPYIVAVRNSDVNLVHKYFIHLRKRALKILMDAERVVFITPSYMDQLYSSYSLGESQMAALEAKSIIIPNGITDFWIENKAKAKIISDESSLELLFVGEITPNKNIEFLVELVRRLNENGKPAHLKVIGHVKGLKKSQEYANELIPVLESTKDVEFIGEIRDFKKLRKYYRQADIYIMTSTFETFGLVYGEAMSQGTPVIYTKGQGIDGYFLEGSVGHAVEPGNLDQAEQAIDNIRSNYAEFSANCITEVDRFSWQYIVDTYSDIYRQILKQK